MTNYFGTPTNYIMDTQTLPEGPENNIEYGLPPIIVIAMAPFSQGYNYLGLPQNNIMPRNSMLYSWVYGNALFAVDPDADTAYADINFPQTRILLD